MQIEPQAHAFADAYAGGAAQVVWTTLVADLETAVSAFMKIAGNKPLSFLLESVEGGATRGRYSIIGLEPDIVWRTIGARAEINRSPRTKPNAFTPCSEPPLASLRAFIDKHIARPSDRLLAQALGRYQQGDTAAALTLLAEAAQADPDNARLPLTHAKLLLRERRHADVQALIDALPKSLQDQAEFTNLYAHAGFLAAAEGAPAAEQLQARIAEDRGDLQARYQLSALALVNDAYEPALEQLLEIVRRDRGFMNDIGRRGMTSIFALLGREHTLSQRYRVLLNNALN